jgi:predicted MPP superfamily phosphohydrolase
VTSTSATSDARPSRRALLRRLAIGLGAPALLAAYATQIEPFWPEFHEFNLPVRALPAAFAGLRVAHLTDLHVCSRPTLDYSQAVVEHVNRLDPDLVLVTGDLVTHGLGWLREAADAVARLRPRAIVSLGNHDYGTLAYEGRPVEVSDVLEHLLTTAGCNVLRNAALPLRRGHDRIWLIGLEDLWGGHFAPGRAFAAVAPGESVLAMSHNPDTAPALDNYGAAAILAGHTHGGQVRLPGYGALFLNTQDHTRQKGLFPLRQAHLYVSRGVGCLTPARLLCRPEVPIFNLTPA